MINSFKNSWNIFGRKLFNHWKIFYKKLLTSFYENIWRDLLKILRGISEVIRGRLHVTPVENSDEIIVGIFEWTSSIKNLWKNSKRNIGTIPKNIVREIGWKSWTSEWISKSSGGITKASLKPWLLGKNFEGLHGEISEAIPVRVLERIPGSIFDRFYLFLEESKSWILWRNPWRNFYEYIWNNA